MVWKSCEKAQLPHSYGRFCLSTNFPHQEIRWNYGILSKALPFFTFFTNLLFRRARITWFKVKSYYFLKDLKIRFLPLRGSRKMAQISSHKITEYFFNSSNNFCWFSYNVTWTFKSEIRRMSLYSICRNFFARLHKVCPKCFIVILVNCNLHIKTALSGQRPKLFMFLVTLRVWD